MNCNIGESLADYGFRFFEKIHEPIFLINKLGSIVKVNEAGRKLCHVAHLDLNQIENFINHQVIGRFENRLTKRMHYPCGRRGIQLVMTNFKNSGYFLVEVRR